MIAPQNLTQLLEEAFPDSQISVLDLTGTQDHYKVRVISKRFSDKSLVQRHQLINQALSEPLKGPLHALTIEAWTPEEAQNTANNQAPKGIDF